MVTAASRTLSARKPASCAGKGHVMPLKTLLAVLSLRVLCATAFAQDVGRISLPASDLVTGAKPYSLAVNLVTNVSAENLRVSVQLRRSEAGASSVPVAGTQEVAIRQPVPTAPETRQVGSAVRKLEIAIRSTDLAEGEYTGEVTLEAGARSQKQTISFFRMPQDKPAEFPFGVYAVTFPKTESEQESLLREIRSAGLNFLALGHMHQMGGLSRIFDRGARLGMEFIPSVNTAGAGGGADARGYLANGDGCGNCLNHPVVRQEAAKALVALIHHYRTHPAFSGKVYFGDDFTLPLKFKAGVACMACYCDRCRMQFKELAGSEPPRAPTNTVGGIVAADDLWLRWMRYRCGEIFGGFMQELENAKNKSEPGVALAPIHGWSEQPFTRVDVGIYPPLSQTMTAVSSYSYPNLRMQRKDLIAHFELAKMGNRGKDVWMLGLLAMCNTVASPLQVRQNYWNQLAGGYKLISFFSWHDLSSVRAAGETNRAQAAVDALVQCGQHKDWILPAIPFWQDPVASNAVLYSFTTESFDSAREGAGMNHLHKIMGFLREAMSQHVPMKAMAEEEILEPKALGALTSLSLCDARTLPANVVKAIEDYAAAGGRVYQDLDACVPIKGAVKMSAETMVALAGDGTAGRTKVSSPLVTLREFPGGASASYHVFVNNSADRYWGLPFNYGKAQVNYDNDALVRDDSVACVAEFARKDRWLFDMSTGQPLGSTDSPLKLKIEPSWGMVVCALPFPSAQLRVTAPRSAKLGDVACIRIEMLNDRNRALDAAFVVRVDVKRPSGHASRYSRHVGFKGACEFLLPLGRNDETGTWTLSIEGGFPRKQETIRLKVGESGRQPADLLNVISL